MVNYDGEGQRDVCSVVFGAATVPQGDDINFGRSI